MKKKNKMLSSFMVFCREMSKCGFQVFTSYSSHVDSVHTHVHLGKWDETEPVHIVTVWMGTDDYYKQLSTAKKQIQQCYDAHINGEEAPKFRDSEMIPF